MNTLIWLVPLAALLLGAVLRSRRVRRRLRALTRELVEVRADASRMDHAAHLDKLRIHGLRIGTGSLRRRLRAAERDRDDWHDIACMQLRRCADLSAELAARPMVTVVADSEALVAEAMESLDRGLQELEAGP